MIRRLTALLSALLLLGGVGLTAGPAQARTVVPHHGSYDGVDHHGRMVSLSFNGTQVSHFTVGHLVIGGAHVSQGMWHETCHNGVCFKGQWVSDTHVSGAWRYGGSSSWTAWSATVARSIQPYAGTYMGNDHRGLRVHLSFHSGHVRAFTLDHNLVGDAAVHQGAFHVCHSHVCIKGHWESDYLVVGSWRYTSSHEWNAWEAYAYAT